MNEFGNWYIKPELFLLMYYSDKPKLHGRIQRMVVHHSQTTNFGQSNKFLNMQQTMLTYWLLPCWCGCKRNGKSPDITAALLPTNTQ